MLSALSAYTDNELGLSVDLTLKPIGRDKPTFAADGSFRTTLVEIGHEGATEKQLVGFLILLEDVLKNLGTRLVCYWPALLNATINIVATAHS